MILTSFVRSVIQGSTSTDPGVLAQEVVAQLDPADVPDALLQALREVVRVQIGTMRVTSLPSTVSGAKQAHVPSSKVAGVRSGWAAILNSIEKNAAGQWVRLGKFTYDDLMTAAKHRRELGTAMFMKADEYEALAVLIPQYGVTLLEQVPPQ